MPIPFQCPHCSVTGTAKDKHLGRVVACPKCGGSVEIGAKTPDPPRVAKTANVEASTNRLLWVVGSILLVAVAAAAFTLLPDAEPGAAAPDAEPIAVARDPGPTAKPLAPDTIQSHPPNSAAFEYKILSEEWNEGLRGETVRVEAQVADDVATKVAKADLESLAPAFMEKYDGQPFWVYFYTVTPLSSPWAYIIYNPQSSAGEKPECSINDYALEFGPWYFPDRIDRKTKWHDLVWLTLPMANKIVNGATQFQWDVTERTANGVFFDGKERPFGAMKDDMSLSPQSWDISTYDGDVPRFVRLVETSVNYLDPDFSQKIVGKLNSVIGGQEYLNGDKSYWTWMFGRLEVTYHHDGKSDMITIMQTQP